MQKYKLIIISIALPLLTSGLNAKNWYDGVYLGVGLGYDNSVFSSDKLYNKNGSNVSAFLGYNLFKYLALETGYTNGVERTHNLSSTEVLGFSYNYAYLNLLPKIEFRKHVFLGILGVANYNQKVNKSFGTANGSLGNITLANSIKTKQHDIMYNVGLAYEYKTNDYLSLLIKYQYNVPAELEGFNSVSANVKFNVN